MKKNIIMTISSMLLFGVFTGCGTETQSMAESTSQSTTETQSMAETQPTTEATSQSMAESTTNIQFIEDDEFSNRDYETGISFDNVGTITLLDGGSTSENSDVVISGDVITITKEGTYTVSGKLSNGQIVVETDKAEKVQLIFDNVEINNDNSAAIYIPQSDKVFITLEEGSQNILTSNIINEEIDATIYSKEDLTFNGTGSLTVTSVNGNGITSNDDLVFTGGTFNIEADNHGLDANNSIRVANGKFDIVSGKDGLHCNHNNDENLGYIYILNGEFVVDADGDGFDSSSIINIKDGKFDITTGGGMENAPVTVAIANTHNRTTPTNSTGEMQMQQGGMNRGGMQQGAMLDNAELEQLMGLIAEGATEEEIIALAEELGIEIPVLGMQQGAMMGEIPQGEMQQGGMNRGGMQQGGMAMGEIPAQVTEDSTDMVDENSVSRKAIKATTGIILNEGLYNLNAYDDAIHSNNEVVINGGTYTIQCADDAIHADVYTTINGGDINIDFCFEGIEGQKITINGGNIDIYANDDGINSAISSNFDTLDTSLDREIFIAINGGKIVIDSNSEGDGVDSNGNIYVTGGDILISSTTDVRDTTLDFQNFGSITAGRFIATGSASMTNQNFGSESTQCSIMITLDRIQTGDVILEDDAGNVILQFTPVKDYQSVTISIPEIEVGKTYTLTAGDQVNTIEMTSTLYGTGGHQSGGRR